MDDRIEAVCGNCRLYDPARGTCRVVILHEGQRINLPVDPADPCFFEQSCFDPRSGRTETLNEIRQVRFWVEDKGGAKVDTDGTVKMEYPEGFFGRPLNDIL